ncbi:pentapeptide repeat-containing protein [Kribbella sp. VKM Ac-2568]|uniref:pentapeptide repeat-containing protein n=1 Tax=Kribbella sp. VKM Ac-2568 TaxID=2512219 RepID=UPI0010478B65|nr:pentapeptide repeat-containing protein [Kribbella sp. VKM Ac-2568]
MAAAVAGAVALYFILAWLLRIDPHPQAATPEQQKLLADMVKIALGLAAGLGAAVALIVGYRRARVEESASHRDDQRLFSSRYQDAADLIGHDKAAVRLAGIYAMSRLADDWDEQRQQCIDVLCAYLRLPYDPTGSEPGEREVRFTVIRLITAHLQAAATHPWHGHDLDFAGAAFDGGDFRGAVFSGGTVSFVGAEFSGGTVSFFNAVFSGGTVDFFNTVFSGGTVVFSEAVFSGGTVDFFNTVFSGGTVDFSEAVFSDGTIGFDFAEFSDGLVSFGSAKFSRSLINFVGAKFSGSVVTLNSAEFSGGIVGFAHAVFSGGAVGFVDAVFSGGIVDFDSAEFSGGEVELTSASLQPDGVAPQGLPEAPTRGLKLPGWMKQTAPGAPPPPP